MEVTDEGFVHLDNAAIAAELADIAAAHCFTNIVSEEPSRLALASTR